MKEFLILVINPGSTSTKMAIYEGKVCRCEETIHYKPEIVKQYASVVEQLEVRLKAVYEFLDRNLSNLKELDAVVGRGGVLVPIKSGAYLVTELMKERLVKRPLGQHASNLGALMAAQIAEKAGIPAYIYDGVTVDELWDIARITGVREITRACRCHALNMRAVAMKVAGRLGKPYSQVNLIVVHLGGGVTMSAHEQGRMVDVVLDSEGPFSPERAGRIPSNQLLHFAMGEGLSVQELYKKLRGQGGLVSLFGTSDARMVEQKAQEGDGDAKRIWNAMAYQTAKGIGELYITLRGHVDGIALTGGMANSQSFIETLAPWIEFLAPVFVEPGEREMEALAQGILRVLEGEESAHVYDEKTDNVVVHY